MKKILLGLCIAAIFAGCYPKGPTYISDLDLVATNYDDTLNFGVQETFFVFDTVVHITDADNLNRIDTGYDSLIVNRLRENMLGRTYEEVNTATQADLVINISVWSNTTVNYYYDWYSYWGWGYPGYGPDWGWYYPGGYTYVQSYTFGTVLMEMNYPAGTNLTEKTIPVVWTGIVNGLLDDTTPDIKARINASIDQAFIQSPYILRN